MKKYIAIAFSALVLCMSSTSCVQDLEVTPIDPTVTLPEDVLSSMSAYQSLLAKCYQALAVSSSYGATGDPDIEGIDGGFGQYCRALFYMNEFTTDEATCPWNDQTVYNLHNLCWTASDVFVTAMFSRIYFEIALCNEFLRQAYASEWADDSTMLAYIAEARALRLMSYYHAIDMFGNVPHSLHTDSVGSTGPSQIMREDLFDWMLEEAQSILDSGNLTAMNAAEYGRCDQGLVKMIMAKLYLNCEVYAPNHSASECYAACESICAELVEAYPLVENYQGLFCADNDKYWNSEIIFGVEQEYTEVRAYGCTTFIICSSIQASNDSWLEELGINDGWGGINVTPTFIDLFDENDARYLLWGGGPDGSWSKTLEDISDFTGGWTAHKFTNRKEDGSDPDATTITESGGKNYPSFADTDLPIFRGADAYLMLAEAQLRKGSIGSTGLSAWNAVRTRAGLESLTSSTATLDEMINERGRELYWECHRRSDLIRFGLFTSSTYKWTWKGGSYDGVGVDSKYDLMPIPSDEINANGKLTQNAGY